MTVPTAQQEDEANKLTDTFVALVNHSLRNGLAVEGIVAALLYVITSTAQAYRFKSADFMDLVITAWDRAGEEQAKVRATK